MRYALILLSFILSNLAVAVPSEPAAKAPVADNREASEKKQTEYKIDTSSLERAIRESVREVLQKPDPHTDERLETDRKVVEYTEQLAIRCVFAVWFLTIGDWEFQFTYSEPGQQREGLTDTWNPLSTRRTRQVRLKKFPA
jgi:hypothetical protein